MLDTVAAGEVLPVVTAVMNIFTDPQKPVQVEPKVYTIGEPGPDAPLLFTTNFSLTYYTVESDVEASRVPSYILVVDTVSKAAYNWDDASSVLTGVTEVP